MTSFSQHHRPVRLQFGADPQHAAVRCLAPASLVAVDWVGAGRAARGTKGEKHARQNIDGGALGPFGKYASCSMPCRATMRHGTKKQGGDKCA